MLTWILGAAAAVAGLAVSQAHAAHYALCNSPFGRNAQALSAAVAEHCAGASAWHSGGLVLAGMGGAVAFMAGLAELVRWNSSQP